MSSGLTTAVAYPECGATRTIRRCDPVGRRRRTRRTNGVAASTSLSTLNGASRCTASSTGRGVTAAAASVRPNSSRDGCRAWSNGEAAVARRAAASHASRPARCQSSQGYSTERA